MFRPEVFIGEKKISTDSPVFVIAEAGVNHNGSFENALKMIDVVRESGADAVKFQSFKTENLVLEQVQKANYQKVNTSSGDSQFQMLKKLEIEKEKLLQLFNYAKKSGLICLITPFDEASLDDISDIGVPAYKIASTDLTNLPFLEKVAQKGKPILLSTGMSYLSEIDLALQTINQYNDQVVLLQCTANYPIADDEAHIRLVSIYQNRYSVLTGYSDHTEGVGAAPYAVTMGAAVVEKHFTMSKEDHGPDHKASLSPAELISFVKEVRKVESYLGNGIKTPSISELSTRASLQKCLVASESIKAGEVFSPSNLLAKRTGGEGISPIYYYQIIGRVAKRNYHMNDIIINE